MKSTTVLLILVVLAVVLAIVAEARLTPEEKAAKKEARKAARKDRKKGCKYDKVNAVCDETLTPPKRVANLLEGSNPDCSPTKMFPCKKQRRNKACRYNYREAKTAACDPATQMKTVSLKPGQPAECAPTKQIPCNKGANRCIYNWREATCVETAGKFEKTAQKVSGPAECAATKTKNVRRCGRKAGGRKGNGEKNRL